MWTFQFRPLSGCRRAPLVARWLFLVGAAALCTGVGTPDFSAIGRAEAGELDALPIRSRHVDVGPRDDAAQAPRREHDQAVVNGWPLYRTERGQEAFNDAMATLMATDGPAPSRSAFNGCERLACHLTLPAIGPDGWIAPGRLWVSPSQYVMIVHSPRLTRGRGYRRRSDRSMRYFVLHEFINSSRNADPFDTISAHRSSVFVPLYMSKQRIDAKGRRFVVVVQVAPYDVVSTHASNMDSAGPGIEVAKNAYDELEPLQGLAGIVITAIVKAAAPGLEVVNHRGQEGLAMLEIYKRRLARLRRGAGAARVVLPFVPARKGVVETATARLDDLVLRRGASPPVPLAERGIVPRKTVRVSRTRQIQLVDRPDPIGALLRSLGPPTQLVGPIRRAIKPASATRFATPGEEPTLVEPIRPAVRPLARPSGADRG